MAGRSTGASKQPFVVAVETTETGKAQRVKLQRLRRFTKKSIKRITWRT